jgi:hypothetical protein
LVGVVDVPEAVGDIARSRPLALGALAILGVVTSPLTISIGIAASSAVARRSP